MVQIFVQASGRNLTFIRNDFLKYKEIDILVPPPIYNALLQQPEETNTKLLTGARVQ